MPRADLLALSFDDLASITNRGTVKRAERELEEGSPTCELLEDGGELVVRWSDGIICRFPAGKSMHEASCTSGSVGISRHIVRSVLAYQKHFRALLAETAATGDDAPPVVISGAAAWDPGTITDEALASRFRQAAIARARQRFEQGILVDLLRGAKPVARFLDSPCTVRFMVPGDLRYITADCDESLLATYVPLAVWAFRRLPPEQAAGIVAYQQADLAAPTALLVNLDELLLELCLSGVAGCGPTWPQRLTRLEESLRASGLIWPAELVGDLFEQHRMYQAHDARFDPLEVVGLVGELLARSRAIAGGTREVPQLLIRGSASDRVTEIAGGRLIGLGMGVRQNRSVTTLSAFVQDADSGSLAAVERSFADPAADTGESPKSYADLAATVLSRGVSLAALSQSQILLKSGKRTPSGRLVLPRTAASLTINPQAFAWEQLKPPAAVEDFAQLADRLRALPPSYLRPRRVTESLCVCPVQAAQQVEFDEAEQRLKAVLVDRSGGRARLVYPFHSRARAGFDALLAALRGRGGNVRFVSGHVTNAGHELAIQPIMVVFDDVGRRTAIQPFVGAVGASGAEPPAADTALTGPTPSSVNSGSMDNPLAAFIERVRIELSELILSGVRRAAASEARRWSDLAAQGRQLGFVRLVESIGRLAEALESRARSVHWEGTPAGHLLLHLCLLSRIAADAALHR